MDLTAGDVVFLDTNVLLTATDTGRPLHDEARWLLGVAGHRGLHLAVSGQIVREYLAVATRPLVDNGLGLRVEDALTNVRSILERTIVYEETSTVLGRLLDLVGRRKGHGKGVHDLQVAATALVHGCAAVMTENIRDFEGIEDLSLITIKDLYRTVESLPGASRGQY